MLTMCEIGETKRRHVCIRKFLRTDGSDHWHKDDDKILLSHQISQPINQPINQ